MLAAMDREGCVETEGAASHGPRGEGCHGCYSALLYMVQMANGLV